MKLLPMSCLLGIAVLVAGCTGKAGPPLGRASDVQSGGVLTGRVTIGPSTPNQAMGSASESPVAGARLQVSTVDGSAVTSVQTDAEGYFSVTLPPATYTVTMEAPSSYGAMFTKELPATVTILPGEKKRLDVMLDTGIR